MTAARNETGRFRFKGFGMLAEAIGRRAMWTVSALAVVGIGALFLWDAIQAQRALQAQVFKLMLTCGRGL